MALFGKFGRRPNGKNKMKELLLRSRMPSAQDVYRREARIRIAPKHPGMGRR
jgi:hypothetical protein